MPGTQVASCCGNTNYFFIIVKVEEGLNSGLSKSCSPEPGIHESQVWSGGGYQQLADKGLTRRLQEKSILRPSLSLKSFTLSLSGSSPLGQISSLHVAANSHLCASLHA